MNLQGFAALKKGDKIDNNFQGSTNTGEVTEVSASGVRVVWGARHSREMAFFYSVSTTAWMHWSKTP